MVVLEGWSLPRRSGRLWEESERIWGNLEKPGKKAGELQCHDVNVMSCCSIMYADCVNIMLNPVRRKIRVCHAVFCENCD